MKTTFFFLFLLLSIASTSAQSLQKVSPDVLQSETDFKQYENYFIDCVDWLNEHPADDPQRISVNAFVFKWIEGCPYITVTLETYLPELSGKNPGMLILFLGNWAKFAIENPTQDEDEFQCNLAALKAVIAYYKAGNSLKKDKKLIKLIKKSDEGKLEHWLEKRL